MTAWKGFYFDGCTAARRSVMVELRPEGLVLFREDGPGLHWPYREIRIAQGQFSGEPIRLLRGGETLVLPEPDFLQNLPAAARQQLLRPRSGRQWVVLAAWLCLALLAAGGAYHFFLPPAITAIARRVPPAWEERVGQEVFDTMFAGGKPCADPEVAAAINRILGRFEPALPLHSYQLRIIILQGSMVNAFALPGGRVVIMSGLFQATGNPEELAGVLAHELAHVFRQHPTQAVVRNVSSAMLLQLLLGNDNLGALAAGGLQTLEQFRFSRQHEREADLYALELLSAAGIDPRGMTAFLKNLEKAEGFSIPAYLSTHPATADRISYLEQELAASAEVSDYPPLFSSEEWRHLVSLCQ